MTVFQLSFQTLYSIQPINHFFNKYPLMHGLQAEMKFHTQSLFHARKRSWLCQQFYNSNNYVYLSISLQPRVQSCTIPQILPSHSCLCETETKVGRERGEFCTSLVAMFQGTDTIALPRSASPWPTPVICRVGGVYAPFSLKLWASYHKPRGTPLEYFIAEKFKFTWIEEQ